MVRTYWRYQPKDLLLQQGHALCGANLSRHSYTFQHMTVSFSIHSQVLVLNAMNMMKSVMRKMKSPWTQVNKYNAWIYFLGGIFYSIDQVAILRGPK